MPSKPLIYKTVKRYNVPGHAHFLTFSTFHRLPLLTNEAWRAWLGESVRQACDHMRYALWAYVFMPEHVHLLVRPMRDLYNMSDFLSAIKKPLAERIFKSLAGRPSPLLEKVRTGKGTSCRRRFWQGGGGYDLNVWSKEKALAKAEYCHNNPVQRRLVKSADQWKWSSFRWIEMGRREGEPLRLDEWDA